MKLLLTSKGLNTKKILEEFKNLLTKPMTYVNVQIFYVKPNIPNFDMDAYINQDKQRIIQLGVSSDDIREFDLSGDNPPNLDDVDVVLVLGGASYHYMYHIRRLGYTSAIIKYVNSDKIYVGRSAGAVIMGPDIDVKEYLPPSTIAMFKVKPWTDVELEDTSGFGVVDFITVPHIDSYEDTKVLEFHKKTGHKMIYLTDEQGILVINDLYKII